MREAIEALLTRQDSNGSFGLWSVGGDDVWLDSYVTDFLTRARERKIAVPEAAFKLALDRLRNMVANTTDVSKNGGTDLAYALYVLARNGAAPIGDLRYIADAKLDALSTPIAKAQIAAALAMAGDRARAERVYAAALEATRAGRSPIDRPRGLRLDLARCGGAGRARERGRRAARHGAGGGAARRGGARDVAPEIDAGRCVASVGRERAGEGCRQGVARCRRHGHATRALPHYQGRRSEGAAAHHQYRRG